MSNELTDLREKLNRYFSLGELKTICFDLRIDHESLDTGNKPALVESLIVHLGRTGRMPELLALVREQRQHVDWPDISQVDLETAVSAANKPTTTINQTFHGTTTVNQPQGDVTMGDTITIRDIVGSNVNIKSTLTNVSQTVGAMPNGTQSDKETLKSLIEQLSQELEKAPADKKEDAEAVADAAEAVVDAANKETPNQKSVTRFGDNLKQAAEDIKDVMPTVLQIALQVVATIGRIVGLAG
ncbi:MAG: hypothetical protein KDE56_05230 [Anaerolineales bacterium]|nr:hypothetical protein [Anaerolineales bacterium]